MLSHDFATLAAAPLDVSLDGMETLVWARADAIVRFQRLRRAVFVAQGAALAVVLVMSVAAGVALSSPSPAGLTYLVAAQLAPSSLLGAAR